MGSRSQALQHLQEYVKKVKETEYHHALTNGEQDFERRVDRTLKDLSAHVHQAETVLAELRARHEGNTFDQPSPESLVRIRQLRVIKATYEKLTPMEPNLPAPGSPLPALIAIRNTRHLIAEMKESIPATHTKVVKAREKLAREERNLRDAHLVTGALEKRIEKLRLQLQETSQKTSDERASDMLKAEEERAQNYEKETKKLVKALVKFINEHLAAMLAAEELGGPVVGDLLDISDDMLIAGFNSQGKPKKPKAETSTSGNKRQQRIDQIWGPADGDNESRVGQRTEKEAAAAELRTLTEDLLNVAVEEGSGAYVALARDSAAARFLVRAKVAQFHPKDAKKLRLLDFGRLVDD